MWNLKTDKNELIYKTETDPPLWLPKWKWGVGMNSEFGISRYKLLQTKETNSKVLLHSTGNYSVYCNNLQWKRTWKNIHKSNWITLLYNWNKQGIVNHQGECIPLSNICVCFLESQWDTFRRSSFWAMNELLGCPVSYCWWTRQSTPRRDIPTEPPTWGEETAP